MTLVLQTRTLPSLRISKVKRTIFCSLSRCVVCLLEPRREFLIDLRSIRDAHPMADHGVETSRWLQTLRRGRAWEIDSYVHASFCRRLHQRKLLLTAMFPRA